MPSPVLERIYPDNSNDNSEEKTNQLHFERYHFAGCNLKVGMIADIACGSGYGSFLLATKYKNSVQKIFAVDNNNEAIDYAKRHYSHSAIDFIEHDAICFQAPCLLNTIISLETIEHLNDPEKFVKNLVAQLAKGGCIIASAPITPSMDANPYHLHDFTIRSFKKLFMKEGLAVVSSYVQIQKYNPLKLFGKRKGRTKGLRHNLLLYYFRYPNKLLLRLWSLMKDGFCNKYLVVVFEKE